MMIDIRGKQVSTTHFYTKINYKNNYMSTPNFCLIANPWGRTGFEMGIRHISKTTGSI